jgi:hypothetical protein
LVYKRVTDYDNILWVDALVLVLVLVLVLLFVSGAVPRPGDPGFIPSELVHMWQAAGNMWVEQQLEQSKPKVYQERG